MFEYIGRSSDMRSTLLAQSEAGWILRNRRIQHTMFIQAYQRRRLLSNALLAVQSCVSLPSSSDVSRTSWPHFSSITPQSAGTGQMGQSKPSSPHSNTMFTTPHHAFHAPAIPWAQISVLARTAGAIGGIETWPEGVHASSCARRSQASRSLRNLSALAAETLWSCGWSLLTPAFSGRITWTIGGRLLQPRARHSHSIVCVNTLSPLAAQDIGASGSVHCHTFANLAWMTERKAHGQDEGPVVCVTGRMISSLPDHQH